MDKDKILKKREAAKKIGNVLDSILINTNDPQIRRIVLVMKPIVKTMSDQYEAIFTLQNEMKDIQKSLSDLSSNEI